MLYRVVEDDCCHIFYPLCLSSRDLNRVSAGQIQPVNFKPNKRTKNKKVTNELVINATQLKLVFSAKHTNQLQVRNFARKWVHFQLTCFEEYAKTAK